MVFPFFGRNSWKNGYRGWKNMDTGVEKKRKTRIYYINCNHKFTSEII